jgi:hypothetical protein
MNETSNLFCKDCKNSIVPLVERILHGIFFIPASAYKCRLGKTEKQIQHNPVTGPKFREVSYEYCSIMRSKHNTVCGVEGKSWTPKNKKHLFLAITRGE